METLQRDPYLWQKAKARAKFQAHLLSFLFVNATLWVIWAFTQPHHFGRPFHTEIPWPLWVTFFWGLGLIKSRHPRSRTSSSRLLYSGDMGLFCAHAPLLKFISLAIGLATLIASFARAGNPVLSAPLTEEDLANFQVTFRNLRFSRPAVQAVSNEAADRAHPKLIQITGSHRAANLLQFLAWPSLFLRRLLLHTLNPPAIVLVGRLQPPESLGKM